jgi:hypothetical protein
MTFLNLKKLGNFVHRTTLAQQILHFTAAASIAGKGSIEAGILVQKLLIPVRRSKSIRILGVSAPETA